MEKLTITQGIVVEGKYDKARLSQIVDGLIIPVHGFSIFTDDQLKDFIVKIALEKGIIILTDSDSAGFKIRGFLKGLVPSDKITNLYIPDVYGKERRKYAPSKEGKLGVEGIDNQTLKEIFTKAGLGKQAVLKDKSQIITSADFIKLGLSGGENSLAKRKHLYKELGLPEKISTKASLEIINSLYTKDEFISFIEKHL